MNTFKAAQSRYDNLLPEDFEPEAPEEKDAFADWEIIEKKLTKARTKHCCFNCGHTVVGGETYTRVFGRCKGRIRSECQCQVCANPPELDYEAEDDE